jgi:hypothetical protein
MAVRTTERGGGARAKPRSSTQLSSGLPVAQCLGCPGRTLQASSSASTRGQSREVCTIPHNRGGPVVSVSVAFRMGRSVYRFVSMTSDVCIGAETTPLLRKSAALGRKFGFDVEVAMTSDVCIDAETTPLLRKSAALGRKFGFDVEVSWYAAVTGSDGCAGGGRLAQLGEKERPFAGQWRSEWQRLGGLDPKFQSKTERDNEFGSPRMGHSYR